MCEPTTWFLIASTLVSGAGVAQQSSNARAQSKYQNQIHEANKQNADENAKRAYAQIGARVLQERESAAAALLDVSTRAEQARSTALVTAGETGTTGISVNLLLADFTANEVRHADVTRRNLENTEAQLELQGEAIRAGQQAQVLQTLPQPVATPNFFGAAARIATQSLGSYLNLSEALPEGGRAFT